MAGEEKIRRIDELTERLNEASRAYYDDASEIMTNYEYDAMYDELLALEAETGYTRNDSPSVNVGFETSTALPKVTHPTKMLSLNKTKDREELKAWLGSREGLLSWKLDGLTVVLTYENGRLSRAVTRGNGVQGELITANALACRNVPETIACTDRVVIRGEAVIRYSDFRKINEAIADADAKYKNPRNLCSGSIRQLDPSVTASRSVYFYAFTLTAAEGQTFVTRQEQLEWMRNEGFDIVDYMKVTGEELLGAIDRYEEKIPDFDIPSDGLVLILNDIEYASTLGSTAKYPRDAIAFKWRDQQAETVLREIEWSPSRTGLLNPVAVFDPVELEGTTVSRASVHNINIMEELRLGIGDRICVYKANMIIPQISENMTRSGNMSIPRICPVCGGTAEIRDEGGTRTLHCTSPDCLAKNVKKFSHFVSRDALNIEGLSEAGLLKLMGIGAVRTFADLFHLECFEEEIIETEGFGRKSYERLIASVHRASHTTPARLLYSLGIPGIGTAASGLIAGSCRNKWSEIQSLSAEELLTIDGIGEVMSGDYVRFFEAEENRRMLEELLSVIEIDEGYEETGAALEGKTFVITGSLEHYASRRELKAEIESEGGRVAGSVSSKTDYLVTNDPGSGSSKNRTARALGVEVITEEQLRTMLGH